MVEVVGGGDYDMSWFRAGAVAPLDVAEQVVRSFPANGAATLKELAELTGLSEDRLRRLLAILVTRKWIKPVLVEQDDDIELELTRTGWALAK